MISKFNLLQKSITETKLFLKKGPGATPLPLDEIDPTIAKLQKWESSLIYFKKMLLKGSLIILIFFCGGAYLLISALIMGGMQTRSISEFQNQTGLEGYFETDGAIVDVSGVDQEYDYILKQYLSYNYHPIVPLDFKPNDQVWLLTKVPSALNEEQIQNNLFSELAGPYNEQTVFGKTEGDLPANVRSELESQGVKIAEHPTVILSNSSPGNDSDFGLIILGFGITLALFLVILSVWTYKKTERDLLVIRIRCGIPTAGISN